MNKINKILSLAVCVILVFSVIGSATISVSADPEMTIYIDNIDGGRTRSKRSSYPTAAYTEEKSDVFISNVGYGAITIQEIGTNEDGSVNKVLKTSHYRDDDGKTINDKIALKSREITYNAGEVIRFSMDIRFISLTNECTTANPDTDSRFFYMLRNVNDKGGFALNESSEGANGAANKLQAYNAGNSAYLTPVVDKWYRAIAVVEADGSYTTSILDTETDEIIISNTVDGLYDDGDTFQIYPIHFPKIRQGSGTTMIYNLDTYTRVQIDNTEIAIYDPSELPANVTKVSVEDTATQISRNKEISVNFDQAVSGNLILKKGGETVPGVSTVPNAMKNKLTLNYGGMLDRNTTYTISFSEIVNGGGLPCNYYPDITFTTEDLHIWNDIEIDQPTADGTNTALTFTLGESYGYTVVSGGMMAMLYRDNKLVGIDMVDLTNQNVTSAITKSFNLGGQPQAGDTVRLMLVDTVGSLVPFAVGSTDVQ